jgi:tRNA(Ile2)-agmatinylcytidine synthase
VWIGVDDTDAREGMCTTYLALEIIEEMERRGYALLSFPRLVRLNPNIPWKTRGNGAIALRFGRGVKKLHRIGEVRGREVWVWEGEDVSPSPGALRAVMGIVERRRVRSRDTSPGIVVAESMPSALYWRAVRDVVWMRDVVPVLEGEKALFSGINGGRGVIGAAAAIAWDERFVTYELLTYLPESEWFRERWVDDASVAEMERRTRRTFDSYDPYQGRAVIKPSARTPVLYGIRGTLWDELVDAMGMVSADRYESWLIFATNQGSDDHIVETRVCDVRPFTSCALYGRVVKNPVRIRGGHVIFSIDDGTGEISCAAYRPTGPFRDVVQSLRAGDEVVVYGGVRDRPLTLNLEKIRVVSLIKLRVKVANPRCPCCGKSMESIGRNSGYRCRKCGTRSEDAVYRGVKRDIAPGWYEVPPSARRHLAMPLALLSDQKLRGVEDEKRHK